MRRGKFPGYLIILLSSAFFFFFPRTVLYAAPNINITKHNLSITGPGTFKALAETRICVFCHTPHNATPDTPLWNKELQSQTYTIYTSDGLPVIPSQPTGPTKLCLSCHDGTVALGATVNPAGGISMGGGATLPPGSLSYFGTNLSNHHPVVFSYPQAQSSDLTGQLVEASLLPPSFVLGGPGMVVHCNTCHDPHDDTYGRFLVMDNRYSALCTACHQMSGWSLSAHATNTFDVTGILPRPPKDWPAWTQMSEWGCEVCHTPHLAATPPKLMNFCADPCPPPYTSSFSCTTGTCHTSTPAPIHPASVVSMKALRAASPPLSSARGDIGGQIKKRSAHRQRPGHLMIAMRSQKSSSVASASGGATCADCHNAHTVNNQKAVAPEASGLLRGVSGVDINGGEIKSVNYEFEICFKCHGDYNQVFPYVPRVVNTANIRTAFAVTNPSFHPVVTRGQNNSVPSIPSQFEPALMPSSMIYCTDCHSDDSINSRGPHGSDFVPILRERYETADNTVENFDNYALCYRCHDRTSILSDASFKSKTIRTTATGGGHSGHLLKGAPCSACHDSHGIVDDGMSGSHTHLINFDTRIVSPAPGYRVPFFCGEGGSQAPPCNANFGPFSGTFSGSCTLTCHGRTHVNETYPQGSITPQGLRSLPPGFKSNIRKSK